VEPKAEAPPAPEPEPEPAPEPEPEPEPEPQASAPQPKAPALDLNQASFDQLCKLGLSVKEAARVIGHREQRGGFSSPADLDQLSGLPPETIAKLKQAAGA
jgi:DNA uptake protein ComE-like DNA-binding protein